MTQLYVDSSTLIYLVEGSAVLRERIGDRLDAALADPAGLATCPGLTVEIIAP